MRVMRAALLRGTLLALAAAITFWMLNVAILELSPPAF